LDPQADPADTCRHRIFVGTLDARLIALDGASGRPCNDFGEQGQVWLNLDVRAEPESEWVVYTVTSPPVIVGDTVVVGSAIGRNASDPAYTTWDSEEAARNGSANAWAPLAADPELGLVYVPTGSASPDFYGGERKGDNLYANSLVALRAATGEIAWYRQLVHHDVWDYDLASQPTLVELERDGEVVAAVLQGTKTGHIFSFNRKTGEPIYAIEERPVPQGGVEGEHLSPTQPFPVAPPSIARSGPVNENDAWGILVFDKRACRKKMAGMRSEGLFTPPSVAGTIELPGYGGGINWGGLAFDPASETVVTFSMDVPMEVALIPRDALRATRESGEFAKQEFAPRGACWPR
jgi:quinoprotein glucose dehydrogenase